MPENRKQLTDTQFRLLVNAQIKFDEAAALANEAREYLSQIRSLVLDAHSIPTEALVSIDPQTQELVIEQRDLETVEEPTE